MPDARTRVRVAAVILALVLTRHDVGAIDLTAKRYYADKKRVPPRGWYRRGRGTESEVSMRVLGYARVSTDEQRSSGAGLAAQRAAIVAECRRRGWDLVEVIEDAGLSGKDLKRPGIQAALDTLARGDAAALVVAKLDRLSRSMLDFAAIMTQAQKQSWALVALDVNVDTTTPAGEAMAHVMATFAQFERRLIGQRTREALEAKRRQGVRLGRPPAIGPELADRIRHERAAGATLRQIAQGLTDEGIPTPRGGREWRPSSLERVLHRRDDGVTQ
jgi:DNA invertase Pin-like site-specific DNA recombinase